MRRPSHLVKNRFGIYYYCIVFPLSITAIIKKKQARRSLRTSDRNVAVLMAQEFTKAVDWLFKRIAAEIMNWIEIKQFLDDVSEKLFQKYVQKVEQVGFTFEDKQSLATILPAARTFIGGTGETHIDCIDNDPDKPVYTTREEFESSYFTQPAVVKFVDGVIDSNDLNFKKGSDEYKQFCRQALEMLNRLDQRKANYYQQMMQGQVVTTPFGTSLKAPPATNGVVSISLRELIKKYVHLKTVIERKWGSPRTKKGYIENLERIHEIFEVVTGKKDIPIGMLTREHARMAREILAIIPANLKKKHPNTSLKKICAAGLIMSEIFKKTG